MTAPRRRRPLRRRLAFVGLAALLVLGVVEAAGALAWRAMTGAWFGWAAAEDLRRAAAGEASADAGGAQEQQAIQQVANHGSVAHPFVGFVNDADLGPVKGFPVSRYGFVDGGTPLRARAPDRFVVGVTGGSVALQMALYAEHALVAELQKSPLLAGREVEVVRLALGGWKQPQQLFAAQLSWLRGGGFDVLVNIDGFNEVALVPENVDVAVPGWYPRGWRRLMDRAPSPAQQRRIGRLLTMRDARRDAALAADAWWWSPTLQSLWLWGDRRSAAAIAAQAREVERAAAAPSFEATGPGTEGRDRDASRVEMVAVWRRASRALDALCGLHDTRYFHFLQPNQYVPDSKPIGAEEARVALGEDASSAAMAEGVRHAYPLLRAAGRALREDGVAFTDLTDVFAAHPEPLYVDSCCHVGRRGYEILAAAVAAAVRAQLDLEGFACERLVAEPAELQLDSPATAAPLRVLAVDAADRRVDVSGRGLGTRVACEPADLVEVAANGAVRALRRGQGALTITRGAHRVRVPVRADWPTELSVADGVACDDGAPALRVADRGAALQLVCGGLPPAGFRLLAASLSPLPADLRPGEDAFGVATSLLGGDGATAAIASPLAPMAGRPLFLRIYVVDAATAALRCTSDQLVVTGD